MSACIGMPQDEGMAGSGGPSPLSALLYTVQCRGAPANGSPPRLTPPTHTHTTTQDHAALGDLSLVMKGETVLSGSRWAGVPAVPVTAAVEKL